ncbi:cupin domain-containing protein [Streptomyces sp. ME02-8801-2C]|uniref:cupin domain-containing protein n=1 Tax=Streptomyces sp. ME02-8801-2C TaxID=3028680 RepID=UPI0029BECC24|nr:cupin domain-containing protein [Streptomyces sp. ME02-8801-2C]MDX3455881.1 cupin domain-containing protein [Streptomyces sp. ME02-8801-2C]
MTPPSTSAATSTSTEDYVGAPLPTLFTGMPGLSFAPQELVFQPVVADGRTQAEMAPLYTVAQTGEDGPAAAVMHYLPGAKAPSHLHPGFELIYVLSGELETDDGVYAAGSLLVMPPNSVHAPRSPKGCVGLVVWERPVQVV